MNVQNTSTDINETWTKFKDNILKTAELVCGKFKTNQNKKQTVWWNNNIKNAVAEEKGNGRNTWTQRGRYM